MRRSFCFLIGSYAVVAAEASLLGPGDRIAPQETTDPGGDDELRQWLTASMLASWAATEPCPLSCRESGNRSAGVGRFLYPEGASLTLCNETMMIEMAHEDSVVTRACTADHNLGTKQNYQPGNATAALCPGLHEHVPVQAAIQLLDGGLEDHGDDSFVAEDLIPAGRQILEHFASQTLSCEDNALAIGYSRSSVLGVFSGARLRQNGVTATFLGRLLEYASNMSISQTTVVQLCEADGRGADYVIGIIASSSKRLPLVREAINAKPSNHGLTDGA